jgi:hypothetical protein
MTSNSLDEHDMSASQRTVPPLRSRESPALGRAALVSALVVALGGFTGFLVDLIVVASHRDPFDPVGWPVAPQIVVELQLVCMVAPLALGLTAAISGRGRPLGIAAIAIAVFGNLAALGTLLVAVGFLINSVGTLVAPHEASSVGP